MASNLNNNGSFTVSSSAIQLRANSGGVPLSHNDVDSNFENLRLAHNSVVTALAGKSASSHTHSNASTTSHGFMSSTDKNKLNGIATSANNYSLPTASSSTKGGVKIGSNVNISSGVISVPLASTTVAGVVEYDNNTIKKNSSGQLYVNQGAVNTNTTYSAGGGISLSGTTFSHKDTSNQASSNNSGRTYIQDIMLDGYGHVTGINTATETVVNTDTNTTYSAGSGLSLSGTTFSHKDTSSANSVNNSGNTVIQDISIDTYGHVTGISSKTISTSAGLQGLTSTANLTISGSGVKFNKLSATDGTNVTGSGRNGHGIIIEAGSGYGSSQSNRDGGDSGHIILATDYGGPSDEDEGSGGAIYLHAGGGIITNQTMRVQSGCVTMNADQVTGVGQSGQPTYSYITEGNINFSLGRWHRVFSVSPGSVKVPYNSGMSTSTPNYTNYGIEMKNRNTYHQETETTPEGRTIDSNMDEEDAEPHYVWLDSMLGTHHLSQADHKEFWGDKFWKFIISVNGELQEIVIPLARGKTHSSDTREKLYASHYYNLTNPTIRANSQYFSRYTVGHSMGQYVHFFESYANFQNGGWSMVIRPSYGLVGSHPYLVAMYYMPFEKMLHYSNA